MTAQNNLCVLRLIPPSLRPRCQFGDSLEQLIKRVDHKQDVLQVINLEGLVQDCIEIERPSIALWPQTLKLWRSRISSMLLRTTLGRSLSTLVVA